MSSLAGALDESHVPKADDDIQYPPVAEEDVEMADAGGQAELQEDEEMDDLFGNDEVEDAKQQESAASPSASAPDSERLPSPERERRQALEYEEEEIPPEIAVEVKEAEVSFANLPVPKGSDGSNWVIRMPNFVKVDSKPFHPDIYMGPEHDEEELAQAESQRERSMTIKLKVENTLRWRWTKDESGVERRESNSRVIRWSDGTLSLKLGKELFDINQSLDTSAAIPRQLIGSLSSQTQPASHSEPIKSQGLTYLVAQHKRSQVLQSEAIITGHMSLRPTGMQSETHRMLVRAVGQKHNKVARLRMAPDPTMDPEREKMELIKQSAKKSKKRNDPDDILGGGRKRRYSRKTNHDVWSDDDDDVVGGFEGSEEEDIDRTGAGSSGRKSKRKDDEGKGPEDYQEDDFVVADSSEDEAFRGSKKRKGDDEEEDPLDKLDAKIREQEDAQRRRRESDSKGNGRDSGGDSEKGADMEVESEEEEEEEEEELKVRRSGTGSRKRAVVFQDDDEDE
ncbi:hypothetical protein DXG03_007824 [Asterophora parasitica]|uniref:RNA polymerase-associated protein LEO1 n=1 Tax=Asterophora parasitica TaxID=117018 RepID=A0A9P7GEN4_9AGAR|nr:hypothetical protein DXG03_007824 [Asterophora parasitica]